MYRFLMADDEEIVRRGFETKIDWAGQGFEFLPPCANGRDAIAAIDELLPDVVMTDIHMPHADGISVAAHAMERHPEIVVVILSGYDEFGYAQAAIRNNVFDYVLKPVSSRDLTALLAKLKAKLDADRRTRDDETALKEKAGLSGDLLRERSLAEFAAGSSGAAAGFDPAAVLGFDPGKLACSAIVVERDGNEQPIELGTTSCEGTPIGAVASSGRSTGDGLPPSDLRALLASAVEKERRAAAFFPTELRGGVLIFEPDPERCRASAAAIAATLCDGGRRGLRVGVGRAYANWIDAPRSYAEASAALAYRLVRAPTTAFEYAQGTESPLPLADLRSSAARLCLGVRTGAVGRVADLARVYIESLASAELSPQRVRHEILALFSRVRDELAGIGVTSTELSSKLACDYYRFAEGLGSSEAVSAALVRLSEVAAGSLEASSLHEPEWKILDFKEFITRHYADKLLSIGKVAERLSISESYLSKLLRRRLATSFVEYVSDYRVERAKELLAASDMMGYEVAEAVGYTDARYFASLFKKRTGMTPSEYRKSLGDGER